MDVVIQERRFTFSSEYEILGAGPALRARREAFSFPARIQVKFENGPTFVTIQGRLAIVRRKYNIHFADGRDYAFHCEKVRKGVYHCQRGDDVYRLYHHRGHRYSIFRNDRQIAAVQRAVYTVSRGNRFEVRMNRDADVTMVASMVLAMNHAEGESDAYEHVRGSEDRKFDDNWQPT